MISKKVNKEAGLILENNYFIFREIIKPMTDEKNLEKSSQDYKKSQYGSWYKKSEEKKKAQIEKKEESLIQKFLNIFNKK